jgi:hypothetical protein
MSELSDRIRRNVHSNMDGWIVRLMTEAADELDRIVLALGGGEDDEPVELAKRRMSEILAYENHER